MGVNSLWDIVGPAARPVKLEALSRKRLAVDASIWIYQFLKAVRDKEGNSLGQTHIVGFFRRICKLLYFGILPLFVFDGGAPPLKRLTIQKRKDRRQGNRDSAATTAQKLLAIQVQRQAQDDIRPKKQIPKQPSVTNAEERVYLEDLPILHPEHGLPRSKSPEPVVINSSPDKRFVKRDEYHLPELKQFTVLKLDARIMPASEFQEYTDDASFDVVDGVDIDSVDPSSSEFAELPLATQYMILSHLRLRSRLRLGYSKNQLEELFPNSKDFSKFQIQQVQKRNFYTQRLMNVSGMGEENGNTTRRIAGDKDKHYALINSGDGWTLSLGNENSSEVIELDENGEVKQVKETRGERVKEESDEDSDEDLEDVPLGDRDGDDEEFNKAVIESIYDQYKGDYELEKQNLQEFDPVELKQAIEMSKEDYLKLREQEQNFQKEFASAVSESQGFDFGQSILFDNGINEDQLKPKEKDTDKKVTREKNNHETLKRNDILWEEDFSNEEESETVEKELTPPPVKEIPLWFAEGASQFNNPHSMKEFFDEKNTLRRPNDHNDESGIISWSEARELINETDSYNDPVESDQLNEIKDSDLDEIIEILKPTNKEGDQSIHESQGSERLYKSAEIVSNSNLVPETPETTLINNTTTKKRQSEVKSNSVTISSTKNKKATVIDYDFEEQDEERLVRQLQDEETQHAEFTTQISAKHQFPSKSSVTDEQLLQEKLQKAKRDSDEVSETMINDVQELLKRFGIPYITAPMEAEAQCAELYRLGLVDGIVTDDSDCFLFGGSRIYKNMFNQKQYVECYIAEDIEHTVGLDNDKLIELALLLGSDYTEGIKGIGPVLAMEILAEFGNLRKFKEWFDEQTQLQKPTKEKPSALEKNLLNRIKNGKLFLPDNFPDAIVKDAYKHAEVDRDDSEFKWGIPSLDQIRTFLMYNVGWSQARVDEVMIPLIRDMNRKRAEGTQSTIGEFFPQEYISYKKEVNLGKRMKVAASKLKN